MHAQSFVDFLSAYGEAYPPQMRYRPGMDFGEWQRRFREAVTGLMGILPERVPADAEVVESVRAEGHTRHLLRIPVTRISSVPAYLLVPDGMKAGERRPAILSLHGHVSHGMDSLCGVTERAGEIEACRSYSLSAVRSGYIVMTPGWWGWPHRDAHVPAVGTRSTCDTIQMAASMYGLSLLALHVQDGQAALDALAARPEVDSARIGCIGNSLGGRMTMWMCAFDARIRAAVAAGSMNLFRERSLKLSACAVQYPFGLLRYGDVAEVFSLFAPKPLQLQAGMADKLITPSDRDAIASAVRSAYQACGAEESLDVQYFQGGHELRWDLARTFLEKHL